MSVTRPLKIVIANQVVPGSHFVYDINLIQMSYAIASLGHEVTLIGLQDNRGVIPQNELEQLYGVEPNLRWIQLGGFFSRKILTKSAYFFSWIGYQYAKKLNADLIYARDYLYPWFCAKGGIPTYAESHTDPDNDSSAFLRLIAASQFPAFRAWATMSNVLASGYASRGVPEEKLVVMPNGVNTKKFNIPNKIQKSPYNTPSPNIVYTGRLIDENGVPVILGAAKLLPQVNFHLVGGNLEDIKRHEVNIQKLSLENVTLLGIKKHSEIPNYLWHADALLLPYSSNHPNDGWACPLKMGEYLASGTPIVATDTRMLRHWLTDDEVVFVQADNAKAMADGILRILGDSSLQEKLSKSGVKKAQSLSYKERARKMLSHNANALH